MLLMTPREVYLQLPRLHREVCAARGVSETNGVVTVDDVMQQLRSENRSVIRPIVEQAFAISRVEGVYHRDHLRIDEDGVAYLSMTLYEADEFESSLLTEAEKKPGLRFGRAKSVSAQRGIDRTIIGGDVEAKKTFTFFGRHLGQRSTSDDDNLSGEKTPELSTDWHRHHDLPHDAPIHTEKHGDFHPSEFKPEGHGSNKVFIARRTIGGVKSGTVGKLVKHGKITTVHFGDAGGEKHFTEDQAAQLLHIDKEKGTATSRTDIGGTEQAYHLGAMPAKHPMAHKSTELRVPYVVHQGARYTVTRGMVTRTGQRDKDTDYHLTDYGRMGDTHGVSTGRLTKAVSKRIWNPVTVPVPAEHSNHFEPVTYNRVRLARGKLGGGALTTMIRAVPGGPDHPNQSPKNQEKASRLSQGLAQRYPDWGLGAGLLPSRYDALSPKKKEGVDMQIDREVRGQHKADLSGVQHQEIDSPDQSPTHEPTPIPRSKKSARDKAAKIAKTAVSIIADPQHDKIHGREVTQALSRPIKAAAGKVHRTLKALGMAERIGSDIMRRVMNEFEGGGMATLGGPIQILGEPGDFRDSPLYAKRKAEYTARASRPNVPEEKLIEAFMRASETCEALSREFPSYSPEYIHATMINEANAWLISNSGTSIAFPRSASSHRLAL